ncbi:craniofacial development protein 2-like [Bombyx mandarina]|uniref:Craniofacial development protein 2-like n=1 Tax=Bombyx mandarina TaxID=7092 RepID=A0A6J2JU49_BOMMA|nr:craniofacial development protein 2-like [Bombyx mandarina]
MDSGHVLFYSGNSQGKHQYGTGFMVDGRYIASVIRFDAISERLSILRLKGKFANFTLINAYAPTELAKEENKDSFYEDLEAVIDQVPEYDVKIILGDFNAQVG